MSYAITDAVPLEFETFKRGKEGWPVLVCQLCLNTHYTTPHLVVDGIFGLATEMVAKEVQFACKVTQDGIVGPETQKAFVLAKCLHAEKSTTPPGLLAGICGIESSYQWACVSPLNPNNTTDYGVTQESIIQPPSEPRLLAAFNPDASAHVLAGETLGFYRAFVGKVGQRRAWELAALAHNWPAAAFAIAEGNEAWVNKPFAFTTVKGYETGLAYARHYIQVAVAQVTSWTVAP